MRFTRKASSLLVSFLVFGFLLLVWFQRQNFYDWTRLRNYQPPAAVIQLAMDTTMNPQARHIFYVQHPDIEDKVAFNTHCRQDEQTIVLGCYVPPQQGVYLLQVQDPRLAGVQQVTAAHEMLHAAYDRLSSQEKKHVNDMINQAYATVTDPRIRETVDAYKKNGADTTNELHSILATEVRTLPENLEAYYKKYFTGRSKIISYSEQYESAFTERKNKVDQYDSQLADLKKQIDTSQADLKQQGTAIETEQKRIDELLANRQYIAYNAAIPAYNTQINSYNAKLAATKTLINQYNKILDQRNALALEEQQLFQAIDSRLTPQENK